MGIPPKRQTGPGARCRPNKQTRRWRRKKPRSYCSSVQLQRATDEADYSYWLKRISEIEYGRRLVSRCLSGHWWRCSSSSVTSIKVEISTLNTIMKWARYGRELCHKPFTWAHDPHLTTPLVHVHVNGNTVTETITPPKNKKKTKKTRDQPFKGPAFSSISWRHCQ